MSIIETVLHQMSSVSTPQRKFIIVLLTTLMCLRGKANYRNLSRYSKIHEKTYSRWFRREFDFVEFNRLSLGGLSTSSNSLVAAIDCSFTDKSGKHTHGLDIFYNSQHGRPEKGLEISSLAIVDVAYNTAYNFSTRQTPKLDNPDETRVDWYLHHLKEDRYALPEGIRYLLTDGYYSKTKFVDGVVELDFHLIGKLRHDADLRYLYRGPQKPRGRPRQYDGKVKLDDLSRLEFAGETDGLRLYTAVVNSVRFKRTIRVVYLVKQDGDKSYTALLFSTDISLCALDIYRYYKARFQIEFLFRDAKQFTGLSDCQARSREALHFHFNATMTALNLIKLEDRQLAPDSDRHVISIASWKIRKFNEHLLQQFSSMLGLDFTLIKSNPAYETLRNYGSIAA
jgi:Transposase DDE domain